MSVFHLKYRPAKIADLDLVEVVESLTKILESSDMPQCWLFAGPKGSGKTSAARILAKAVNCLSPDGVEPCGVCQNCQEIAKGNSLDIIEIDGASNRGVDDIRGLKESAYLSPINLKKKVVIIDEVHMLTKEAFNALLKILEEPPKNLMFILCTTDDNKIPETVLSRLCQIRFVKGNTESLRKSLLKIITGENIKIGEEAIDMLLSRSDGSFRNLQRNFNEIFLQTGSEITLDDVVGYWSKSGNYSGQDLETDLVDKSAEVVLEKLENLAKSGVNFSDLRESWLNFFQNKLLSFYGIGAKNTGLMDLLSVRRVIDLLIQAGTREKLTQIGQLPLEMAIVEFLGEPEITNPKPREDEKVIEEKNVDQPTSGDFGEVKEIIKRWGEVLISVKPFNHSVEAFLRAARPLSMKNGVLTLEVFYKFHKERLEEQKNREIVLIGLEKVLGKGIEFRCVLTENKITPIKAQEDLSDNKQTVEEIFV